MVKIVPTIGRVVLYFPSEADRMEGMEVHSDAPCAALVAYVHSDYVVNLLVTDHDGNAWARRSVQINVEGPHCETPHAEWMAYQQGQAAKTEKAEAALAAASDLAPEFQQYRRSQIAELRPYVSGEDMRTVSVSDVDAAKGSPKTGDMIARNPKNHEDRWLVAAQYFADNFESAR